MVCMYLMMRKPAVQKRISAALACFAAASNFAVAWLACASAAVVLSVFWARRFSPAVRDVSLLTHSRIVLEILYLLS